jgi:hypothetical protein
MKLRFYRRWYNDSKKDSTLAEAMALERINQEWEKKWLEELKKVAPDRNLLSAMARENALARPYSTYLASAISSDFPAHHPNMADSVLADISKLESGEIQTTEWDGQGFQHRMTLNKVTFEHSIFGE